MALRWISETEATSFTVFDGATRSLTTQVPSAMVTGLASASTHAFTVVAGLPSGCGVTPASAPATATTAAGPPLRAPQQAGLRQISAMFGPGSGQSTVTVQWNPTPSAGPIPGFRIYEGADVLATSTGVTAKIVIGQATTHLISVTAVDLNGNESRQSVPATIVGSFIPPP